ncbi:DUF1963 domain-containing protein [Bradyrhizobium sp. CCGUVB14]|uniref:DUF1963 domain-containing protein n=1 Tax=Bradyrhizobium sp. CCGUVB14 TaxID=2949628 RepID=UPI0020B2F122|nr:DUF1963 domain-containing protein [Bradyrhizobium sp. CCGUVB14]MCP3442901.1 YwqG family protein [Bradyrhizobium sp. CCGUVB14]
MNSTFAKALDANCHPTIWLRRVDTFRSASKLGGLPWLPKGVAWPRQLKSKTPLHFLAQIDLAALPKSPLVPGGPQLPAIGILYFFADMYETMLWGDDEVGEVDDFKYSTRVIFAAAPGEAPDVAPAELPPEVGHAWGEDAGGRSRGRRIFPEAPLEAHLVDTFVGCRAIAPDDYTLAADLRTVVSIERVTGEKTPIVSDPPFHDQAGLAHSFYRLEGQVSGRNFSRTHFVRHQMLGPPTGPHGFSEDAGLGEDVSLFQIDTDLGLSREFSFSQGGPAHFWINRDDLAAGRFDQAYATTA